jgi:hypothetical protein
VAQVCDARMLKRIGTAGLKIIFATLPSPKIFYNERTDTGSMG